MDVTSDSNRIFMISKPLSPPWNDSARLLPKYIVENTPGLMFHVITSTDAPYTHKNVRSRSVYKCTRGFNSPLPDQIRVMLSITGHLLKSKRHSSIPMHYFFTPNKKTSGILKFLHTFNRRVPTIQTITSLPTAQTEPGNLLFTDQIVVLSKYSQNLLSQSTDRPVKLIYPGIPDPAPANPDTISEIRQSILGTRYKNMILYPGDLTFARSQKNLIALAHRLQTERIDTRLVIATRNKHPDDAVRQRNLQKSTDDSIIFAPETDSILPWLAAADIVVFPVTAMKAKMDIPLVLLEAMALKKPVVIPRLESLPELAINKACAVYPVNQPTTCFELINRLLDDPVYSDQMGQQARNRYLSTFTAETMASKYHTLYQELVST